MPTAAQLHYFAHGVDNYDHAPVLLIHGSGGHHLYWPPQLRRLRDHRIYAMDLPGHGRSDGIGRDLVEDYVGDLTAFMDAVGLNSAIWIGHSLGGAIALHAALHNPHRVLGLGMVASGARLRVDAELLGLISREAAFGSALKLIGDRSFSASVDSRLKQLAIQRMGEMRSAVLLGDFVACNAFDESSHLGQIRVPTLIVCGADDRMIPPRASEALHSAIPHSELVVLPDAGHMLMLERPEQTAAVLARFINSVKYRPGVS